MPVDTRANVGLQPAQVEKKRPASKIVKCCAAAVAGLPVDEKGRDAALLRESAYPAQTRTGHYLLVAWYQRALVRAPPFAEAKFATKYRAPAHGANRAKPSKPPFGISGRRGTIWGSSLASRLGQYNVLRTL